ncbi:hypothetical protein BJ546DRAFT_840203 [Cryomyces antarcticus]
MATAEPAARPHAMADRNSRRRPFAAWMKRLANLKNSSSYSPTTSTKKTNGLSPSKSKKASLAAAKNNPYLELGHRRRPSAASSGNGQSSFSTSVPPNRGSYGSLINDGGGRNAPTTSNRSNAPTVATNPETVHSDAGHSKALTATTAGGALSSVDGAGNSTFSSPSQSERSLTTTLTTIQSTVPANLLGNGQSPGISATPQSNQMHAHHQAQQSLAPVQFSHQYPISPPASALPGHLQALQPNPTTYTTATANNILTDNASILTLASSSKRRRRHSLDTDASVRALAPSSVWGGSRESLPLSVLSGNAEYTGPPTTAAGMYQGQSQSRPSVGGLASAERASVYSSSGVAAPALSSERSSYYAAKQTSGGGGGGSIRSGLLGHGRNDSITNSIGGGGALVGPSSPLASPGIGVASISGAAAQG